MSVVYLNGDGLVLYYYYYYYYYYYENLYSALSHSP